MSRSSERGKKLLHCNKTEELPHIVKGPLVSFFFHNDGKFLCLGWHSCASWRRAGEVTLPPSTYTPQIRFLGSFLFLLCILSAMTTTFLIFIFLCSGQPWHREASATQEDWPGSGEYLGIYENLFHRVFGRNEWRRELGQEEASTESKGEGLISSHWNN